MTPEQIKLAKELAALPEPYFKIMRGMEFLEPDIYARGNHAHRICGILSWKYKDREKWYLNFTDHGTAGCLEYLLNGLVTARGFESECSQGAIHIWKKEPAGPIFIKCVDVVIALGECIGEARANAILALYRADGVEVDE